MFVGLSEQPIYVVAPTDRQESANKYLQLPHYCFFPINPPEEWKMPESEQVPHKYRTSSKASYRNQPGLFQRLAEHVVHLVVLELLLEVVGVRLLVDLDVLDGKHLGKIFPVLLGDVVGESTVVRTTGQNPGCSANLECGLRNPESRGYGQLRHGLGLDALNLLRDEAEAVAQVNDSSLDATTGLRGEDETGGLLLADADAEEVYLELWLVAGDERTDLEHVTLQARGLLSGEVQGVVLEERTTRPG